MTVSFKESERCRSLHEWHKPFSKDQIEAEVRRMDKEDPHDHGGFDEAFKRLNMKRMKNTLKGFE